MKEQKSNLKTRLKCIGCSLFFVGASYLGLVEFQAATYERRPRYFLGIPYYNYAADKAKDRIDRITEQIHRKHGEEKAKRDYQKYSNEQMKGAHEISGIVKEEKIINTFDEFILNHNGIPFQSNPNFYYSFSINTKEGLKIIKVHGKNPSTSLDSMISMGDKIDLLIFPEEIDGNTINIGHTYTNRKSLGKWKSHDLPMDSDLTRVINGRNSHGYIKSINDEEISREDYEEDKK